MRAELLALLEEGPQSSQQLGAWLEQPLPAVNAELDRMEREHLVKHAGPERKWALHGYDTPSTVPDVIRLTRPAPLAPSRPLAGRPRKNSVADVVPRGMQRCEGKCGLLVKRPTRRCERCQDRDYQRYLLDRAMPLPALPGFERALASAPRPPLADDFEVVWNGASGPLPGQEDRPGMNSTLSATTGHKVHR